MRSQYQALYTIVANTDHQYLSSQFIDTLILAEDRRFLYHFGFDPIAVIRAIFSLLTKGKLQGASTIEQQLVRTITRRYEITLSRKLREIVLASILSASFPKDRIARAYLCVAYFGWRMNGITQACTQLSINPETATVNQAASIIARLKYPEPKDPSHKRLKQIEERCTHILQLWRERSN
jgi:penicillin-binding protein 1A